MKGRLLRERQIARIVEMLRKNEVLFEASMIDLGTHTIGGLERFKASQAESLTRKLTDQHHPNMHKAMGELRRQLEAMHLPLYVQSVLTFDLIDRPLRNGTLYFCQRRPRELGAFHWTIDAKGTLSAPTPWEEWWSWVVMPYLQSESIANPCPRLEGGDYSFFTRFDGEPSDYLKQFVPATERERPPPTDLRRLLTESFRFSHQLEPGLELVDIVTNAVRRALIGNLGQVAAAMRQRGLSKTAMAEAMKPSRAQLDRLHDPANTGAAPHALYCAASVLGKRLTIELADAD